MRGTSVKIDGARLHEILKKKGLSMSSASEEIGRSTMYIRHCIASGIMSKASCLLIKNVLDIDELEYVIIEPIEDSEAIETSPTVLSEDDCDALYHVIYHAVYAAMKKALSE